MMQKKSSNFAKNIYRDKEVILTLLKERCYSLAKKDERIIKIILFGSLTNETYGLYSDADLLIVLAKSEFARFIDRIPEFVIPFAEFCIPVDIFPYTENELASMKVNNSFIQNILRTRIVIYP